MQGHIPELLRNFPVLTVGAGNSFFYGYRHGYLADYVDFERHLSVVLCEAGYICLR
jgi:hypothetical protein